MWFARSPKSHIFVLHQFSYFYRYAELTKKPPM